ncbi:magnesium transporter [Dermatobacter hominis]|uniref:magnesium transporter n=1 Tax=Dermatobacter hominis TaxID=2884263 RepID=UPI001D0F93C3|nr:magnesium transporter [Dermatobacter hominis]UDY34655.1 magnesium transporter [Dermatobacter hominis]
MARRLPSWIPRPLVLGRRLVALLGPTGGAARQSLVALLFNSATSFVAGAVLGSITGTFEALPGLLVMVPAAIGLRGNIFGTLGNRLSTSIHTGTFRLSSKRETVLGQNVIASIALTFSLSLILAVVAQVIAVGLGVENVIGVLDLALVSVAGGLLASVVVLGATILLSIGAVRRGWDMDNLVAPTVSTLGDVITIPALFLATKLLGHGSVTAAMAWSMVALTVVVFVGAVRSKLAELRQIMWESLPVLTAAVVLSTLAGIAVQKQLSVFAALPALLVLEPAFVSSAGALGGILSSRAATDLHLGIVEPTLRPGRIITQDALLVFALGFPVYLFNAVGSAGVAAALGQDGPGVGWMVLLSLIGGAITVVFVIALAYYSTVAAWRFDVDPDTYGIPVVTASVDFVGVVIMIVTMFALGIA